MGPVIGITTEATCRQRHLILRIGEAHEKPGLVEDISDDSQFIKVNQSHVAALLWRTPSVGGRVWGQSPSGLKSLSDARLLDLRRSFERARYRFLELAFTHDLPISVYGGADIARE